MRRMTLVFTALLLALTACSGTSAPTTTTGASGGIVGGGGLSGGGSAGAVHLVKGALVRFQACDDFLNHVKAEAIDRVGPYGLDWWGGWPIAFGRLDALATAVPESAVTEDSGSGSNGQQYSTTNNQEVGVDEADIVKSDGERIITLTNNPLSVVDVTGNEPVLIGTLALNPEMAVRDLFLHDDKVVLMGNTWRAIDILDRPVSGAAEIAGDAVGIVAPEFYGSPVVTLTEVDISDEPTITRTLQIDGSYLSSRMIDGVARIVVTAGPNGFMWAYPEGNGLRAEREAVEANKKIIEESTIENWVPYYVLTDRGGNVISEGAAIDCDRAHHPVEFGGFNTLNILAIDLDEGLDIVDATSVLATGETVYSSTNAMYVSTNAWLDPRVFEGDRWEEAEALVNEARTQIHQFDISGDTTQYVATGTVRGYLINQFAMSEHNGDLRVASTTSPNWWGGRATQQESIVSVLRPDNGELEVIGELDGLGKDERIYSVRFLGDVGYLVTFRQIDPLFTIDLSDPTNPELRGELKIPGYSSYLHPLADGIVLGIGQDATNEGRVVGSQVSLFDVSDLDNPIRIAKLRLGRDTNSVAEYDHRAFLQWGDTIVVPITSYNWDDEKNEFFTGAVAIDTSNGELNEITRLAHPDGQDWEWGWNATILRSLVVGDSLYTVSNTGIMETSLDGFDTLDFLDFPVR
ncbi:MAG: beta-propeller domain-containing protein [Acidimicrobiia bacterium]